MEFQRSPRSHKPVAAFSLVSVFHSSSFFDYDASSKNGCKSAIDTLWVLPFQSELPSVSCSASR